MSKGAVLLDRDGVVNRERGEHTWRLEDFEILPDVVEALRRLHARGIPVAIITNQSGIGLGLYGEAEVEKLHGYLHDRLAEAGAPTPLILHCPHHPTNGKCLCRKPGHLLVQRAMALLGADPSATLFIGDRDRDVQAAEAAGAKGLLVEANTALLPVLQRAELLAV
ncbi:MAG: HAD family hydrolase [Flavobacteriales bacterium]|nr:MAG: HAD family hydrolase [Flavobacteriales bacterium]